jgi:UDP-N-acetylmuramate dehydrogenase
MQLQTNKSLKSYNTFGLDVIAKNFISVKSIEELINCLGLDSYSNKLILGGGSNILLTKDVDALVIHVDLRGKEIISETEDSVLVKVSAGENWHEFVLWCLDQNFGGIENLSLIPGNVGTAPIQNIGAYGVELKDVFESCEALQTKSLNSVTFNKEECEFDYRNSIFKQKEKGNYIITSVTFKLSKKNHVLKTNYGAIQDELKIKSIDTPSIIDVSNAVIKIRQSKLPDPAEIGNSGSFFKNPIVSITKYQELKLNFPKIPNYKLSDELVKIPAGWLIEKAGFKGKTFKNYGVHKNQALVLVNYGNADGEAIFELSKLIQSTIKRLFGINLEAEVNIL